MTEHDKIDALVSITQLVMSFRGQWKADERNGRLCTHAIKAMVDCALLLRIELSDQLQYATLREIQRRATLVCTMCGGPVDWYADKSFSQGLRQRERCECNECATWSITCEKPHPDCVIEGVVYDIGEDKPGMPSSLRGMSGRRFDIEFFDGRKVTTHDLWYRGPVPERFRDRIMDTAVFAGGAHRVQVGEATCWQPSTGVPL